MVGKLQSSVPERGADCTGGCDGAAGGRLRSSAFAISRRAAETRNHPAGSSLGESPAEPGSSVNYWGNAKSVAREKITEAREKITDRKSRKPAAVVKIEPGKVSLASAQQRVLSQSRRHSDFSSEANVVAKDTVTRYRYQSAPPPK